MVKSTYHVTEYAVCNLAILFHKEHVVIRLEGIFTLLKWRCVRIFGDIRILPTNSSILLGSLMMRCFCALSNACVRACARVSVCVMLQKLCIVAHLFGQTLLSYAAAEKKNQRVKTLWNNTQNSRGPQVVITDKLRLRYGYMGALYKLFSYR